MPNLYLYLERCGTECMDRLIGSIINRLFIPPQWRADVRQQILLAWYETEYDPERQHEEILSYAHRCAFLTTSEWRRRVLLPVTLHRAGPDPEPFGVSFEALVEDNKGQEPEHDRGHNQHLLSPDQLLELTSDGDAELMDASSAPESDESTAHRINVPRGRTRSNVTYEHLIFLLSEGLTVTEVSAVTGMTVRNIYRRLSNLKAENRYAV